MARLDRSNDPGVRLFSRPTKPSPEGLPIPSVPRDLLEHLNAMFPDKLPPIGTPREEIERMWGQREVIEHLVRLRDLANEEALSNVLQQPITSTAGNTAASSPGTTG